MSTQGAGSSWTLVQTVTGPIINERIGEDGLDFDNGTVLISSRIGLSGRGLVWRYERSPDNGSFVRMDHIPGSAAGDMLGSDVAIDGGHIAIGAVGIDSVWFYDYTQGESTDLTTGKFVLPDAQLVSGTGLGESVDIDGDSIITGATGFGVMLPQQPFLAGTQPPDADDAGGVPGTMIAARSDTDDGEPYVPILGADIVGAAFVFVDAGSDAWTHQQMLLAPTPANGDDFGHDVAIDGDRAVVGAPGDDAVYIYERTGNTWTHVQTLTGIASSRFGHAVALDGDYLIVGAPAEDTDTGSISIYERGGPQFAPALKVTGVGVFGSPNGTGSELGSSVDVRGDWVVAGAPGLNSDTGGAVTYERGAVGGWARYSITVPINVVHPLAAGDRFGGSVAISGDWAVVGAPGDDSGNGRVYFCEFAIGQAQWFAVQSFAGTAELGSAVDIQDDLALVGAPFPSHPFGPGEVHVYSRSGATWSGAGSLSPFDAAGNQDFGAAVAIQDGRYIIGSPDDDDRGSGSGSAYLYKPVALNTPPTTTGISDVTVDEDAADTTIDLTSHFADVEDGAAGLTYTVETNTNLALLTASISGTTLTLDYLADQFGTADITIKATDSGALTVTATFSVTVASVNDAPGFTKGSDQIVTEDSGPWTITNWATAISPGPANESSQTLTFNVTNNNNALFTAGGQPAISPTGTLTYTLAPDANGLATVTVVLQDSGPGISPDDNTAGTVTFAISVLAVNDPPNYQFSATSAAGYEDAGPYAFILNTTANNPGPANESSQTLTHSVSVSPASASSMFAVPPSTSSGGQILVISLNPDAYGTATITITATDSGTPAQSASDSLTLTIEPINDEPSFTAGGNQSVNEDAPGQTVSGWATAISAGPANESSQVLTFVVTAANPSLFSVQPAVDATGTLTYTPAPDANGSTNVDVYLKDDGGTANFGDDTSPTQSFTIAINAVNDPPNYVFGLAALAEPEDRGSFTSPLYVSQNNAGPPDEDQTLTYSVTLNPPSASSLFSVQPTITSNGLTFQATTAPDANGSVVVTVTATDSGNLTASDSFTLDITPVNDEPSFTAGPSVTANEDSGAHSSGWASNISAGPSDESSQTLTFVVSAVNTSFFSVQPAVDSGGNLTFTPATDAFGTTTVDVYLMDDGGTTNGGDDRSPPSTFTITINPVNDPPVFDTSVTGNSDVEDSGSVAVELISGVTATVSPGPTNENAQSIASFIVTNDNNSLFSVQPAVDAGGTLTYTPAADANGSATVTIRAVDDGGTANGGGDTQVTGDTLTITVRPVNDEPEFTPGGSVTVDEDSAPYSVTWATAISAGPPDESGQTLSFAVSNDNNSLFSTQPAIDASGNLSFVVAADEFGSATVSVALKDDGGTADGGDDTSATVQFTLTVDPVNDPPSFTPGPDVTVLEDAGTVIESAWATAITMGPANEASQTATAQFVVTNTNSSLFAAQPAIDVNTGNLTFETASDANGSATVSVTLNDGGGGTETSSSFQFTVMITPVNDPPTFTAGNDVEVLEDSGDYRAAWATAVSPGAPNESAQTLSFIVTATDQSLFAEPPAINAVTQRLTFRPAVNAFGSTTVEVVLTDDGGTANGGSDTSELATFTITIQPVNDTPSFVMGSNVTVLEDAGMSSTPGWATAISPGPPNESSQLLTFDLTTADESLFSALPAVDPLTGDLTFTAADDAYGRTTVAVVLMDDGGSDDGGNDSTQSRSFEIIITPVNDAPSFVAGPAVTELEDAGAITHNGWATGMSPGPANESDQTVSFHLTVDNQSLFATPPAVDAISGDLTFTPADDAFGIANITLHLRDDGGTTNGGENTSAEETFSITITPVNDPPSFTPGPDIVVDEDSGAFNQIDWATNRSVGPDNERDVLNQTLTFAVTASHTSLFAAQPAIDPLSGELTFTPAENANGVATVDIILSDNGGTSDGGDDTADTTTFTITIRAVNDPPVLTAPPTDPPLEILENRELAMDGPRALSGADLDVDVEVEILQLSLETPASFGVVDVVIPLGVAVTDGAANSHSITVSGTLDELNSVLASVTLRPAENFVGASTFRITLDDLGNIGLGGPLSDAVMLPLLVHAAPDIQVYDSNGNLIAPGQNLTPDLPIGQATTVPLRIENNGSATLIMNRFPYLTAEPAAPTTASGTTQPAALLGPGQSSWCALEIVPGGPAFMVDALVTSNDPTKGDYAFTINGSASDRPGIEVLHDGEALGANGLLPVSLTAGIPTTVTLTVANPGTQPLILAQPTFPHTLNGGATATLGALTVAPDGSTTVTITLTATAAGLFEATLNLTHNVAHVDNPFAVRLLGQAADPTVPELTLLRGAATVRPGATIDIGQVLVSGAPVPVDLAFRNDGGATLDLFDLTSTSDGDAQLVVPGGPIEVAPHALLGAGFELLPPTQTGLFGITVSMQSNDPLAGMVTLTITGEAVAAGAAAELEFTTAGAPLPVDMLLVDGPAGYQPYNMNGGGFTPAANAFSGDPLELGPLPVGPHIVVVEVRNVGIEPAVIDDPGAWLAEPRNVLAELVSPLPVAQLFPQQTATLMIRYTPLSADAAGSVVLNVPVVGAAEAFSQVLGSVPPTGLLRVEAPEGTAVARLSVGEFRYRREAVLRPLTLRNVGTADLTIRALTIAESTNVAAVMTAVLPATLAPGETLVVLVELAGIDDGPLSVTVRADTDSTLQTDLSVTITGIATRKTNGGGCTLHPAAGQPSGTRLLLLALMVLAATALRRRARQLLPAR
jgi:hypothetical protein